ncbi:MAG: hypothetical protein WC223_11140 [Bacteroidales bacterium]
MLLILSFIFLISPSILFAFSFPLPSVFSKRFLSISLYKCFTSSFIVISFSISSNLSFASVAFTLSSHPG